VALSEASVKLHIQRMLGQDATEGVRVELTTGQLDESIAQALRLFNRYHPRRLTASLGLNSGQQVYVLTDYGKGLVNCVPAPTIRPSLAQYDVFNPWSTVQQPIDVGTFASDMAHLNLARRVLSAEFAWEFDLESAKLYITPIPVTSHTVAYTYVIDRTIAQVPADFEDWFLRCSLSQAKYPLGRMRSKFNSVQGSEREFRMDGEALLSESISEINELTNELRSRTGDLGVPMRV